MGRKKQKVRWTSVNETAFFTGNEDSSSGSDSHNFVNEDNIKPLDGPLHTCTSKPYPWKKYRSYRSPVPLAPRFERKAAVEAAKAASTTQNGKKMTLYYGGESCETEQLPDGFTKIRSKNLDVLFKRNYYSHKIDFDHSSCSSELDDDAESRLDEEKGEIGEAEGPTEKKTSKKSNITENVDNNEDIDTKNIFPVEANPNKVCEDSENSANVKDERDGVIKFDGGSYPYSPDAPPFVPSSQSQPNLFLYSPASNTMIPCEEIMIPNPVMGPDGPIFQGPSNIYLAFPMDTGPGPHGSHNNPALNGADYLSQQYVPPQMPTLQYDQYGMPYQTFQPPQTISAEQTGFGEANTPTYQSTSCDGSMEPSSADSTMPHSPPDLSVYSPSNWAASAHKDQGIASPPIDAYTAVNSAPTWYNGAVSSMISSVSEKHSKKENSKPLKSEEVVEKDESDVSKQALLNKSHIPGLNPDLLNKATKKKKRKKKLNGSSNTSPPVEVSVKSDQNVSTSIQDQEEKQKEIKQQELELTEVLEQDHQILLPDCPLETNSVVLHSSWQENYEALEQISEDTKVIDEETVLLETPLNSLKSFFKYSTSKCNESCEANGVPNKASQLSHQESVDDKDAIIDKNNVCQAVKNFDKICDQNDIANVIKETEEYLVVSKESCEEDVTRELVTDNTLKKEHGDDELDKEIRSIATGSDTISNPKHKSPSKSTSDSNNNKNKKRRKRDSKKETQQYLEEPSVTKYADQSTKNHSATENDGEEQNHSEPAEDYVEKSSSIKTMLEGNNNEEQTSYDGEWETRKKKSCKGRKMLGRRDKAQPFDSVQSCQPTGAVMNGVIEDIASGLQVDKEISVEVKSKEVEDIQNGEGLTKEKEPNEAISKRYPSRHGRKKRYASCEARTSMHQVLIKDGFIQDLLPHQFSSPKQSQGPHDGEKSTLFISSIGHGIQQGPLFWGRVKPGKYNPPDRSNEIPLKYRQSNEEQMHEQAEKEGEEKFEEENQKVNNEIDLD